jgi:S1-C subfamily serine protease
MINDLERSIMRFILVLVLGLTAFLFSNRTLSAYDDVQRAVVKILATRRLPDMVRPWTKKSPKEVSGSGVIIEGKRILTNAHILAYANQIYVQPFQSAEKMVAKLVAEAPGVDLALLEVEDKSFFDRYPSLPMANYLPRAKDTVNVYGYPIGGKEQSVTEGIVSRIDYAGAYYGVHMLRIQIDAALNPGNSGGPAVREDKMVGLVFSKIMEADNIGFLIPVEEIRIFLDDMMDGTYEGQPKLKNVNFQTSENDALLGWLGVSKDTHGIMVNRVRSLDPHFPLQPGDLVTHIGPHPIDGEGHVQVNGDLRLPAFYWVPRLAKDGNIEMTVIRKGRSLKIEVPLSSEFDELIRFEGHRYPRYFIYGPLVFTPVTHLFLSSMAPRFRHLLTEIGSPLVTRRKDLVAFEGEELVALVPPMLPHRVTKGYDPRSFGVVSHVNGIPIKNLVHLLETLRDSKEEYVSFRFSNLTTELLVFRREEIESSTADILRDNGIRDQSSEDLRPIWGERSRD